ncbi:MAG: Bug family tripartite tricarboxylate transporter substrate binding protein [Burkholderiales bacterium]
MNSRLKLVTLATLPVLALTTASTALAIWPADQPIRIIVPQAVGGTNDTVARMMGVEIGKAVNQSVIIENRPGASGAIGMQAVVQAKPDGYTLGLASDSAAMLNVIQPQLTWQFKRDVRGIGMIGDQPISISVSARSPYKSFADVVAAAKAKPGTIPYGTSGAGTSQNVVGEWLARLAGIEIIHIPYKGGGQATNDVLSGQTPIAVLGLAPMLAHAKTGGVRIVAVTTPVRSSSLPGVPTLTELGFPQIALAQWAGLVAATATSEPIVKRMSDEMLKILAGQEMRQRLASAGIDPRPLGYSEFDKFLKGNVETWERVVPSLKLKLE